MSVEWDAVGDVQAASLRHRAEATGRFLDLIYYYHVRDDRQALAELGSLDHPEDRLAMGPLQTRGAWDVGEVRALACGVENDWLLYTLLKHLLSRCLVIDAVEVVTGAISRGVWAFDALNLAARYAAASGETSLARELALISLRAAPDQHDVSTLMASLDAGKPVELPFLDTAPLQTQVMYYLPCYNVARYLDRTLAAIFAQCHPLSEVVLVDDGSEDNWADVVAPYPVRVVRHGENKGLAAARNTAWRSTTAEFVCAVDTDASPEPGYVRNALMAFEQGPPEMALVGGRLIEAFRHTPADAWRARVLSQDPGKARWYLDVSFPGIRAGEAEAHFLTGSNTVVRRSALEWVGGYDERHRTNAEDVRLCAVLRSHGFHYSFVPCCVATHFRRDTVTSVLSTAWQYSYWYFRDSGCFGSLSAMLALIDDRAVASHHGLADAMEAGRTAEYYIDFLYAFYAVQRDLQEGIRTGVVKPGQAAAIWQGLESLIDGLDRSFGGRLLEKVRADLAHLPFDTEASRDTLGPDQEKFDALLDQLGKDYQVVTETLYRILAQP